MTSGDLKIFKSDGSKDQMSLIPSTQSGLNLLNIGPTNQRSLQSTLGVKQYGVNNAFWVTGHSGAGDSFLAGQTTSGASAEWPLDSIIVIKPTGFLPNVYRLTSGTSGTIPSLSTVRPNDYFATVPYYWNSISLG